MHDDSINAVSAEFTTSVFLRPFAKGTILAFELVLRRSMGDRVYDRSLAYLNGTDARDLRHAFPAIKLDHAS